MQLPEIKAPSDALNFAAYPDFGVAGPFGFAGPMCDWARGFGMIGRLMFGVALAMPLPVAAQSASDVAKGKALFLQCAACHSVARGAPNKVGPNLNGMFGAKVGTRPGFTYSPAMKSAKFTWDDKSLDAFMAKPQASVPGTRMAFGGVANADARKAITAYLRSVAK